MSSTAIVWTAGVEDVTPNGTHGDMLIEVTEYDWEAEDANENRPVLQRASFKVCQKTMDGNPSSVEFRRKYLRDSEDERFTVDSVRLWLRVIHGTVKPDQSAIPLLEVWNALGFGVRWGFHLEKLKSWFEAWWSRMCYNLEWVDYDYLRSLLFPAYILDHAQGFADVTLKLSLITTTHIEEQSPVREKYHNLHVPNRVIEQMNAAKGSMKGRLNEALLDIAKPKDFCPRDIPKNIGTKCKKRAECIEAYLEAVSETKIWPLRMQHRKSIQEIIDSNGLRNWSYIKIEGACPNCDNNLQGKHIAKVRKDTIEYWSGLCLDCMKISTAKTGTYHSDYWNHNSFNKWGDNCRLKDHQRNTWYHSFMGRREIMEKYQREQKERERQEQQGGNQTNWFG